MLRYGALSILFLGGMLAAIVFVFFKISAVEVISDANMKYRDVDVQMMCGFSEGQNMFAVSYDEAEEKIEQALPYIEKCTIKKRIPSTVLICVESAEPIGTVALRDGQRAIISHTGKVLELLIPEDFDNLREEAVTASDLSGSDISQSDIESVDIEENSVGASTYSQYVSDSDLAVIQGVAVERAIVGRPIESSDGTAIETVCEIMRLLDKYELTATAVDVTPGSITVNYQNRLELKFGTTIDLEKKMEAASIIILQEKVSVHENGRLDLTNPNKVVFTPEYLIRR